MNILRCQGLIKQISLQSFVSDFLPSYVSKSLDDIKKKGKKKIQPPFTSKTTESEYSGLDWEQIQDFSGPGVYTVSGLYLRKWKQKWVFFTDFIKIYYYLNTLLGPRPLETSIQMLDPEA